MQSLPSSQPGDHTRGRLGFKVARSQEGQPGSCAGQDQSLKQDGGPRGWQGRGRAFLRGRGSRKMPGCVWAWGRARHLDRLRVTSYKDWGRTLKQGAQLSHQHRQGGTKIPSWRVIRAGTPNRQSVLLVWVRRGALGLWEYGGESNCHRTVAASLEMKRLLRKRTWEEQEAQGCGQVYELAGLVRWSGSCWVSLHNKAATLGWIPKVQGLAAGIRKGHRGFRRGLCCAGPAGDPAQGLGACVRGNRWAEYTGLLSQVWMAFPSGFQLTWACTRPGTIASILGTLPWGGGQPGLSREVRREAAHCHSWYGSLSRSRTPSGLTLGSL